MSLAKFIASLAVTVAAGGVCLAEPPVLPPPSADAGSQPHDSAPPSTPQPDAHGPQNSVNQGTANKPSDPDDEIICKRDNATGTRVSRHKLCLTRRQWRESGN